MKCALLSVGRPRAGFIREGIEEYRRRLGPWGGCELVHVRPAPGSIRPEQALETEARRLLKALRGGDCLWVLDINGKPLTSQQWAQALAQAARDGFKRVVVAVGGHMGISEVVLRQAQEVISLGRITLCHELAALVAMEQLYRAHCILAGHPYHRR